MASDVSDNSTLEDYEQYENPTLCAASASGNLKTVKTELQLWKSRLLPSEITAKHLNEALRSAITAGHSSIVSFLLDQGAQLSPIMILEGLHETTSMFQVFLDHGWDINERTDSGAVALKHLVSDDAKVKWFLDHGADPTVLGSRGESIITVAAHNATPAVMDMLVAHGAKSMLLNSDALHIAAERSPDGRPGGNEMLVYLLDYGMNINQMERTYYPAGRGWAQGTPLHCAVMGRNLEGLNILLKRGADRDIKSTHEQTPLDLALAREFEDGVKVLKNS